MAQKIIKIGSSEGVILPKKKLKELGLKAGDMIEDPQIKPATKNLKGFSEEVDDFMKTYEKDLENLAQR